MFLVRPCSAERDRDTLIRAVDEIFRIDAFQSTLIYPVVARDYFDLRKWRARMPQPVCAAVANRLEKSIRAATAHLSGISDATIRGMESETRAWRNHRARALASFHWQMQALSRACENIRSRPISPLIQRRVVKLSMNRLRPKRNLRKPRRRHRRHRVEISSLFEHLWTRDVRGRPKLLAMPTIRQMTIYSLRFMKIPRTR